MAVSRAQSYRGSLVASLAEELGWSYEQKRHVIKREVSDGFETVALAGSNKWSPLISVNFYFGKSFNAVTALEKKLNLDRMSMHVCHYSLNFQRPDAATSELCTWRVDLDNPPQRLVTEIASAIRHLLPPFVAKYQTIDVARAALANDDPGVLLNGDTGWPIILRMDLALNQEQRFREWARRLDAVNLRSAEEVLSRYASNHRAA
jgi:hypothetical protein